MAKKKETGGNAKSILVAIFLVGLLLFYFNHLSNNTANRRTAAQKSEIEQLSEYDYVREYPKTPRDVVKLHNRYLKLFYGQSLKDDELEVLNNNIRRLYCKDLLFMNPEESSLGSLKADIKNMKEEKISYKLCELPEGSQVTTYSKDGKEYANLEVQITLNTKDQRGYLYVEYVLIKENDQWKIYGWGQSKRQGQTE